MNPSSALSSLQAILPFQFALCVGLYRLCCLFGAGHVVLIICIMSLTRSVAKPRSVMMLSAKNRIYQCSSGPFVVVVECYCYGAGTVSLDERSLFSPMNSSLWYYQVCEMELSGVFKCTLRAKTTNFNTFWLSVLLSDSLKFSFGDLPPLKVWLSILES